MSFRKSILLLSLMGLLPSFAYSKAEMCAEVFSTIIIKDQFEKFESDRTAPYQSDRDHSRFFNDPLSVSKRKTFEELGYVFTDMTITMPSFEVFIKNYNHALDKRNVPQNLRLQPSLVLENKTANDVHFEFLIPGKDPWPTEPTYRLLNPQQDPFNIPAKATIKGLREGRWPLLDAFHDASHFASFIENPSYMMAIVKSIQSLPTIQKGSSLPSRIFSDLELLALADPAKIPEIRSLLATPEVQHTQGYLPLKTFSKKIESFSDTELIQHAEILADRYASFLKEYGAGVYRPYEKLEVTAVEGRTHGKPLAVLYQHLNFPNLADVNDINSHTFAVHIPNRIKAFIGLLKSNPPFTKKDLETYMDLDADLQVQPMLMQLLKEQTALAEYVLWNSSQIPVADWIKTSLGSEVIPPNSPVALMIRDVFGKDSFQYQILMKAQKTK